jgi:hypothetical protein
MKTRLHIFFHYYLSPGPTGSIQNLDLRIMSVLPLCFPGTAKASLQALKNPILLVSGANGRIQTLDLTIIK